MPKPRKALVSLAATPYYHCVSRCVRRAFLCGTDAASGADYEHRRHWIEERMRQLASVFAVDLCAYAVMSNHYHVVVHIDRPRAEAWSDDEIIDRWLTLFTGPVIVQRYKRNDALTAAELDLVDQLAEEYRHRLADLGWFMRCLNEPIARQANAEDNCTGRFWEGRYKSQALLDEKALAACMAYVDLNPVRAGMAETPEYSDHTSIQARISHARGHDQPEPLQPDYLYPFVGNPREAMPPGLPFPLHDYLELVDWTGRILREDKRGSIAGDLPPILDRLQIDPKYWIYMARRFESRFRGLVGSAYRLKAACTAMGYQRSPGLAACRELLA